MKRIHSITRLVMFLLAFSGSLAFLIVVRSNVNDKEVYAGVISLFQTLIGFVFGHYSGNKIPTLVPDQEKKGESIMI